MKPASVVAKHSIYWLMALGAILYCGAPDAVGATAAQPALGVPLYSGATDDGKAGSGLPVRSLPQGFRSYNDPEGTGRLIYVTSSGGPTSAKATMRQFLSSFRSYFDGPIRITGATGDPQDTVVQAIFLGQIGGQPVQAVAAVAIAEGGAISGLIYDRPASLGKSYARLSSYFSKQIPQGVAATPASASAGPDVSTWKRQTSGDRSTSVLLPPNWNLLGVARGSAELSGPMKESVVLGLTFPVMSQPPFPGAQGSYAPYMSPEQALSWYVPQFGVKMDRVLERAPGQNPNPSGQAEYISAEFRQPDGSDYKGLALVMTTPMAMNTWMFYISSIAAPDAQYDASFPTMAGIWKNWKLDDNYVQKSLADTARIRGETADMISRSTQRPIHAYDNLNESFDQILRGVTTMENTGTGQRAETQAGTADAVIKACRRQGATCREVPVDELVRPQ